MSKDMNVISEDMDIVEAIGMDMDLDVGVHMHVHVGVGVNVDVDLDVDMGAFSRMCMEI